KESRELLHSMRQRVDALALPPTAPIPALPAAPDLGPVLERFDALPPPPDLAPLVTRFDTLAAQQAQTEARLAAVVPSLRALLEQTLRREFVFERARARKA